MNTKLAQRGTEIEARILHNLALFDWMTLNQCIASVYCKVDAAGTAAMQRKLKQMMSKKLIDRVQGYDGLYRYYLLTAGARIAAEFVSFTVHPGTDRQHKNSSRRDMLVDALISDSHTIKNCIIIGPAGLRQTGWLKGFDGGIAVDDENGTRLVKLYVVMHTPTPANRERFERARAEAKRRNVKFIVLAENFTKKLLGLKN